MTDDTSITDAEWEVMNVLWDAAGPMTADEVVARLAGRKAWSPRTVKTLLNRLIRKGPLAFEAQGKRYLYRPAVARERCVRAAATSFLARVFGGSAGPMLAHFVTHSKLSDAEVAQLRQLLDDRRPTGNRTTKKGR